MKTRSPALPILLAVLFASYLSAQPKAVTEAEVKTGVPSARILTDILSPSPPETFLDESQMELVKAGWGVPGGAGDLTLFSDGTYSLARNRSSGTDFEGGSFGTEGSVLLLKPEERPGTVWRYRLVEFGASPRRLGLRLETAGAAGGPPSAFYDLQDRHYLPSGKPLSVDKGYIEILPVGWSRDGRFAYIARSYQNDGRGAEEYRYVLLNTVTDEVEFDGVGVPMDYPIVDEQGLDSALFSWTRLRGDYTKILAARGVVPLQDFTVPAARVPGVFPLSHKGDVLTAVVALSPPVGADPVPFSVRRTLTLTAQSKALGRKTVTVVKDLRMKYAAAAGYFLSPFEDRIAIVVSKTMYERNWESPPDLDAQGNPLPDGPETSYDPVPDYGIYGCNLRVGFRK